MKSRPGRTQQSGSRTTRPFTFNRPERMASLAEVREANPIRESTRSSVMDSLDFIFREREFPGPWLEENLVSNSALARGVHHQPGCHRILNRHAHGFVDGDLIRGSAPRPRARDQLAYFSVNVFARDAPALNRPGQIIGAGWSRSQRLFAGF